MKNLPLYRACVFINTTKHCPCYDGDNEDSEPIKRCKTFESCVECLMDYFNDSDGEKEIKL
jgi:hypothetical protein